MNIGVFAPSRYITSPEKFAAGIEMLKSLGHAVKVHPQCHMQWHQFAGHETDKATAFHNLLRDPDVDVILSAAGGNRALHFLDHIDWDLVRKYPKPVIGYSDVTALLCALHARAGVCGFHGPTASRLGGPEFSGSAFCKTSFQQALSGAAQDFSWPADGMPRVLRAGVAEGPMIGGNLCLLANLAGTSYGPDFGGAILFIEDIQEKIWNIDRMLLFLRRAGKNFDKIRGVIAGGFTEIQHAPETGPAFGLTLQDLLEEHFGTMRIPVVMDAPFGHGQYLPTFPFGRLARLEAEGNGNIRLGIPRV